jgi:hypothetical protein
MSFYVHSRFCIPPEMHIRHKLGFQLINEDFFAGQGRTMAFGEAYTKHVAAGNPRRTKSIRKKTIYGGTLFSYHPCEPHGQWRVKGNYQKIDEQQR